MPCFVIVSSVQCGQPISAVMCDPGASGYPNRTTDTPVKITVAESSLTIDDEPRAREIISCSGLNGTTTYLINGSTSGLRNRERRIALAKASALLNQLRDCLVPLINETKNSDGLAAEGLGLLFNWIAEQRSKAEGGGDDNDR